ncbi:MAG TPA: hypothetical protein VGG73_09300 [Vicinamibacterales bacterium]
MHLRHLVGRATAAVLIVLTALVSVGLTAPADAPFAIRVHAMLLGVDVDVTIGSTHLHAAWSAIPVDDPSTNHAPPGL